ncbi:protein of unknown function [Aminobacter niigataensis]|nr:protein of unknown function [Aminobacter niigataensis]
MARKFRDLGHLVHRHSKGKGKGRPESLPILFDV